MSIGPFQILFIALVIILLFGRGRISELMGDFGKGIKSFRQGIGEADQLPAPIVEAQGAHAEVSSGDPQH